MNVQVALRFAKEWKLMPAHVTADNYFSVTFPLKDGVTACTSF